jgi:DUF1009 family protein
LIKTAKVGQDKSIDLPSIGVDTVKSAAECSLNGIALGTKNSQIIDSENTISAANDLGIFILGF